MKNKKIQKILSVLMFLIVSINIIIPNVAVAATATTYTLSDTITAKLSTDGTLTISGTGDMPNYTSATKMPWYNNTEIKKVVINSGITKIGNYNFYGLTGITSVTLPNTIKSIGNYAFYNCTSLSTLNLKEGLEFIGVNTFQLTALQEITIPATVKSIGTCAFTKINTLKEFKVADGNENFWADKGVLYSKSGYGASKVNIVAYPIASAMTSYNIPEGVTTILTNAFTNATNLKQVTIPNSIKEINGYAFSNTGLTSVTVPAVDLEEFGQSIWEDCANLETVNFNANIKDAFSGSRMEYATFKNCTSLKNINFTGLIEEFYTSSFENCTALEEIEFPEGTKVIDYISFKGCTSLKKVTWPSTIIAVSRNAFKNCSKLAETYPTEFELKDDGYYREPDIDILINGEYKYDMAREVLEYVNQERKAEGLNSLVMDEKLFEVAQIRAAELSILFQHERPNYMNCFSLYPAGICGENIAKGYTSARAVVNSWMDSQNHRANILSSDFTNVGIGCFVHNGIYYWVQCFIDRGTELDDAKYQTNETKTVTLKVTPSCLGYECSDINLEVGESTSIKIFGTHCENDENSKFIYQLANFTYKLENENIATYKNGIISAKEPGNTTINIMINGKVIAKTNVTVKPPYTLGDINDDGKINARDAKIALQSFVGEIVLTEKQKLAADVNKDGKTNARDAKLILQLYTGSINEF